VAGEIATRLGQTALVGQLLVGVVLGPTLIGPYIGLSSLTPELSAIQFLATVFILFMAGLDIVPEQISRMGVRTALMGVAVFAVPFATITVLARLLMPGSAALLPWFLGVTLSITALPVMGIMLVEFGLLKTRIGNLLINTALVNELTAVTVFAILLQLQTGSTNGLLAVAVAVLSVAVFIGAMFSVHMLLRTLGGTSWWESTRIRIAQQIRTKESGFAILMICVFGASLFSQYMGLTFVVGAFYAGILVTRESAGPEAHRTISSIFDAMTWGFFVPLFFAFVGVQMNFRLLLTPVDLAMFAAFAVVAIVSKYGTGFLVARFNGWPPRDARAIGHLVSSRGAVELAMAVILLGDGVFHASTFTLVAGVGLVCTLIAPMAAARTWRLTTPGRSAVEQRMEALRAARVAGEVPVRALAFQLVDETAFDPTLGAEVGPEPPASPPGGPGPGADSRGAGLPPGPPPLPKKRSGGR
jgi:Kef-type K+ transport system membrane component KefB